MKKFVCSVCGYIYDEEQGAPDNGVAPAPREDVRTILFARCAA